MNAQMQDVVTQDHEQQVQEMARLMQEATAARHDFTIASEEFAALLEQENELLATLLQVAFRMQAAKLRTTAALTEIRRTAGFIV